MAAAANGASSWSSECVVGAAAGRGVRVPYDPGTTLYTAIYAQPGGELRWQLIGCCAAVSQRRRGLCAAGPWSGKQISKLRLSLGGLRSTN